MGKEALGEGTFGAKRKEFRDEWFGFWRIKKGVFSV